MILRIDKLATELPRPKAPNANAAAAVQELMGGKFGEMSTLMNYTFQSFNFRGRSKLRPFYDLVANIAAEEYSHIELVAATINLLCSGTTKRADRRTASGAKENDAPLANAKDFRNAYHFIASGQSALPVDSMGNPWNGTYVFSSGNLKLDLLHNFFLECGARANKIRVYEMTSDPTARAMIGFLLVRGGVHIVAYARALEKLTGADVGKLLPIPDVSNKKFPEARRHEDKGLHRILFRFSPEDYTRVGEIWNGPHPEDGEELIVENKIPEGAPWPELDDEPQLSSPGVDPDMIQYFAKAMGDVKYEEPMVNGGAAAKRRYRSTSRTGRR
ncbi:MAG TPA: manganese catalase family protein [Verrucomicrobiae bacterium]|nr:manganese catalase family protein [Verrucomicrobiae bacterium]